MRVNTEREPGHLVGGYHARPSCLCTPFFFIYFHKDKATMSLDKVSPGKNVPESFNVIIEIPMNADPVKYEVDKESGAIFVDRFMSTSMHYPTNYGYVPKTISGDGDPVDVQVTTTPGISGTGVITSTSTGSPSPLMVLGT